MYQNGNSEKNKPIDPQGLSELSPEDFSGDLWGEDPDDNPELFRAKTTLTMKIIALLTALIFFFIVLGNLFPVFTRPGFLQESRTLKNDPVLSSLQQAVVQVLNISREQANFPVAKRKGTGFNIHPSGLIVTNKHLVEDADAMSVAFEEHGTYNVERWILSPHMDLALLYLDLSEDIEMPGPNLPVVELQFEHFPKTGEEVLIMGNPLGFRGVISRGIVTGNYRDFGRSYAVMEIEAPVHPGSSGSPVFNGENKVVAVVYATLQQDGTENKKGLAIPVSYLLEIMEEDDTAGAAHTVPGKAVN